MTQSEEEEIRKWVADCQMADRRGVATPSPSPRVAAAIEQQEKAKGLSDKASKLVDATLASFETVYGGRGISRFVPTSVTVGAAESLERSARLGLNLDEKTPLELRGWLMGLVGKSGCGTWVPTRDGRSLQFKPNYGPPRVINEERVSYP